MRLNWTTSPTLKKLSLFKFGRVVLCEWPHPIWTKRCHCLDWRGAFLPEILVSQSFQNFLYRVPYVTHQIQIGKIKTQNVRIERFEPRWCHLWTSEFMHLFSQHMTQPCKSMWFARLFFAFEHLFERIIFAIFLWPKPWPIREYGAERTGREIGAIGGPQL